MRRPTAVVSFVLGLAATAATASAQGVREFTVVQRDTLVKPFWVGYSFRSRSSGSASKPGQSGYTVITDVVPGSPAERAGLKVGDEILSINGYDRATRPDSARYFGPGKPVPLRVRRGESIVNLIITPEVPPAPKPKAPPAR